ncbi:hypothetical protein [Streptomyces shaanxiensis]
MKSAFDKADVSKIQANLELYGHRRWDAHAATFKAWRDWLLEFVAWQNWNKRTGPEHEEERQRLYAKPPSGGRTSRNSRPRPTTSTAS